MGLEVPFAFVFAVSVMIIEPERMLSVWITVVGDRVTFALVFLDTIMVANVFVMVADIWCSEVPHGCVDLLL